MPQCHFYSQDYITNFTRDALGLSIHLVMDYSSLITEVLKLLLNKLNNLTLNLRKLWLIPSQLFWIICHVLNSWNILGSLAIKIRSEFSKPGKIQWFLWLNMMISLITSLSQCQLTNPEWLILKSGITWKVFFWEWQHFLTQQVSKNGKIQKFCTWCSTNTLNGVNY